MSLNHLFYEYMSPEEKQKQKENYIRRYKRETFGPRYQDADLSRVQMPENVNGMVINFMKKPQNMLVFCGSPGLGKTYFCAALTEWAMLNFDSQGYKKEEDLLRNLREGISQGKGDYLTSLKYMIDMELYILDDVGSGINPEKSSYRDLEFRREVLFSFLDRRYNSMLPTIITTNFNRSEFEQVYSDRIVSRLFAAENTIIEVFGQGLDKRQEGM